MRFPLAFGVLGVFVLPTGLAAQVPAECRLSSTPSNAQLRQCIDALNARRVIDSVSAARDRVRLDSVVAASREIRLQLEDIYRKMPPAGVSVADYVASLGARPDTTLGTVVNGDLILNGRLCIPDACIGNAGEQIQIRGAKAAGILFQANRDGTWHQSPCSGISTVGMSPDLGLRLVQNQRWSSAGEHINFICASHPTGTVGFDSQAEWSFSGLKPGQPPLGTQRLVIRTDEGARVVYFATWAEGWRVEFRGSTDGCKWCENVRWKVPYQ